MQKLGDDEVRHRVVDLAGEEDHPLLEQAGVEVERALATGALLDDGRDQHLAHGGLPSAVQPIGCTMLARPRWLCNSGVA
jgi:hypothetical protein